MKKIIILPVLLMIVLNTGCSLNPSKLFSIPNMESGKLVTVERQQSIPASEKENLDEAISRYLEQEVGFRSIDGKVFEAHELYGIEKKDGKAYAYLWSRIQEYVYEENTLIKGSGISMPVVVVLEEKEKGKYTAVEFIAPRDGDQYTASIKEMFPREYHDQIFTRANTSGLGQILEQKAENYFISTGSVPEGTKQEQEVKSPSSISEADGDVLTAAGIYTGQIDNNTIEIVLDNASGESEAAAFRFSTAVFEKFQSLSLETGDAVKISYTRNGYDQLVLEEIEKVVK